MSNIRPFAKRDTLSKASIEPLLLCPLCNIEKIIELAERGLRNPTAIHLMAMTELKSNSHPTGLSVNG